MADHQEPSPPAPTAAPTPSRFGGLAPAALRMQYRIARLPAQVVVEAVLPHLFDDEAAVRLVCEHLLADCDRVAARRLGDTAAAVRADRLRHRTAVTRYAIARRQCRALTRAEVVLAGHRDRFEQRRCPSPGSRGSGTTPAREDDERDEKATQRDDSAAATIAVGGPLLGAGGCA